ncbi:hypothetical protein [Pseudohaliea sp.]|uniref:hypothetical protein n=1 Tax=Pseudohaliea sp. TaxID=2740289 RepID=UPI0032EEB834
MKPETLKLLQSLAAQFEVDDPLGECLLDEIGALHEKLEAVAARAEEDPSVVNERLVLDVRSQLLRCYKQLEMQATHRHSSRRPKRGRPALASV